MKRRETLLNNSRKRTGIAFKLPFVIQEVFRLFSLADAHLFCKANRDICTVSVSLLTPSWLFCYLLRKLQTPPRDLQSRSWKQSVWWLSKSAVPNDKDQQRKQCLLFTGSWRSIHTLGIQAGLWSCQPTRRWMLKGLKNKFIL